MSAWAIVPLVLLGLPLLLVGAIAIIVRRPLPKTNGTLHLDGLHASAEVIRDGWGVPHIRASSLEDLIFAQGYVHAQDRLWQMELQRRLPSGTLSEIFGDVTLEADRFMRTVGLRRAAEECSQHLADEELIVMQSYARGVNAFIAGQGSRLPLEFALLKFRPEPWTVQDTLTCSMVILWNLSCNWEGELLRARLATWLGADRAAELEPPVHPNAPAIVHGPTDGPGYLEVAAAQSRSRSALRQAYRKVAEVFTSTAPGACLPPGELPAFGLETGGSNSWVVTGGRSTSGAPMLANDTHLALGIPSVWYECHLKGAGLEVSGLSFAGIPGIIVGHNERVAWGLTTAWQDVQDLYVERLNPDNPHQAEWQGQWEEVRVVRETIRVKGSAEPVVEEVLVTRHGPIISKLVGEEQPLSLRWVGLEPQHMVRGVVNYNRARDCVEFKEALRDWSCPAHNFVFADTEGNIGYCQPGWVPLRSSGFGIAPVPGWTGEFEWLGYLPFEELPQAANPPEGWLATANHKVVDERYPHFLSADWEHSLRAQRIVELLSSREKHSIADFLAMQLDDLSPLARLVQPVLAALAPAGEEAQRAVELIAGWDCRKAADSVAASLFEVWMWRFLHDVLDEQLGGLSDVVIGCGAVPLSETSALASEMPLLVLSLLTEHPPSPWLLRAKPSSDNARRDLLLKALDGAIGLLQEQLGPDMGSWRWGRLHRLLYAHPLGRVKPLDRLFNRGPFPLGGSHDTLLRGITVPRFPFPPIISCDSQRMVCDLGDWRRSVIVTTSGQSGHPGSRHYDDQIPLFVQGRHRPMLWDWEDIEREAEGRLVLAPR
jgi:penicillin amidase